MIDTLMTWLSNFGSWLASAIMTLLNFLAYPLGWLIWALDGLFYLLYRLFDVVVLVVQIFTALFQYFFALLAGFLRTITSLLFALPSGSPRYPGAMNDGIKLVVDQLAPTGIMTVVPMVLLALIWLTFVIRIFALLGGTKSDS